jgi:hypothetical protein
MEENMLDKQSDPNAVTGQKFGDMSAAEKLVFLGKVCVFLVTAGFVYPNIFVE